ncbi:hypothetical protein Cs7R123_49870 [Catellatospora sp. TT07R-123]|uniref:NADAR family protein n=1 Tax=Catellatospora sp. TT07R-123 TaxID=2733863 RepID=UPI001B0D1B7E|nr:NADAR family protein [Catellatospora sp. TT07R-123]GHJ47645.1 hypothetical protein Cs7R123_49870 [Catellatospora sp. TT07R-123]
MDGEQIPGRVRPVFVGGDGRYILMNLAVYADGAVECGGPLLTLEELRTKIADGSITVQPSDGARVSAPALAEWRATDVRGYIDADMLHGELLDVVEQLNGRPDSKARCRRLIVAYRADRSEHARLAVRAAYLAIPAHRRRAVLSHLDPRNRVLRTFISEVGQPPAGADDGPEITERQFRDAVAELVEHSEALAEPVPSRIVAWDDVRESPTAALSQVPYARGWHDPPGVEALTPDYPARISAFGSSYPSITHAILALAAADPADHDRIARADGTAAARAAAKGVTRRADWHHRRLAVMGVLLRAKLTQHPELADILLATGDGRITYSSGDDGFWTAAGANWIGRLLETIRSELALSRTP